MTLENKEMLRKMLPIEGLREIVTVLGEISVDYADAALKAEAIPLALHWAQAGKTLAAVADLPSIRALK